MKHSKYTTNTNLVIAKITQLELFSQSYMTTSKWLWNKVSLQWLFLPIIQKLLIIYFFTLIQKMHSLNFSTDFLYWAFNYLTHRQHFVQIDSNCSSLLTAKYGVPQGSILDPILFNLCVAVVESLIFSRLDYCNNLFIDLPQYQVRRMIKLKKSFASCVKSKYCSMEDVVSLKWLLVPERIDFTVLKMTFKGLLNERMPSNFQISIKEKKR